jgi:DNA polymerase III delta prime subunit
MSFAYKYVPVTFDDFLEPKINEPVEVDKINTLRMFITLDQVQLLLVGDSATGKTTLLNAFLQEYYAGIAPRQYSSNVLFINSLKEQGIQFYRSDVKTFCQTCSAIPKKKKIIVLDDLDFISDQCQQVFRSYVEKFSRNVHFLTSCTNIQKVIESLQSRFHIIKCRPLSIPKMMALCQRVQEKEQILMDPMVQAFVCNISGHSVKAMLNYLEKFYLYGNAITLDTAKMLCCTIGFYIFDRYTRLVKEKHLFDAVHILYDIFDKGYSVMDILDNFFLYLKASAILTEQEKYLIIPYICKYITVFHSIHENEIELALFTANISLLF